MGLKFGQMWRLDGRQLKQWTEFHGQEVIQVDENKQNRGDGSVLTN
jgi:hypothetical protein